LATGIWLWFHKVGIQLPVVRLVPALVLGMVWHDAQLLAVGTCEAILPVAEIPLWQLVQLVAAVKVRWSMPMAGSHALVVWHWLQVTSVTM
jgi:hypothetical protein